MALKIEHRHKLDGDAATTAAEKFALEAQNDPQMTKYVNLDWVWRNRGIEMDLDLKGRVKIKGFLKLEPGRVLVELDLPLLAKPFAGVVKERVQKALETVFV
ncbi:MAG: hypothetical protein Kow0090_22350 [Myxococcota bacterium]